MKSIILKHVLSGEPYKRHLTPDGIKRLIITLDEKKKHLENHHNVEDRHKFIERADDNIAVLLSHLIPEYSERDLLCN